MAWAASTFPQADTMPHCEGLPALTVSAVESRELQGDAQLPQHSKLLPKRSAQSFSWGKCRVRLLGVSWEQTRGQGS